jgi:hypothetical protein
MPVPVKKQGLSCNGVGPPMPSRHAEMRAKVLIPADLPVTQIEIEVLAALLDDWDAIESDLPKKRPK